LVIDTREPKLCSEMRRFSWLARQAGEAQQAAGRTPQVGGAV